MVAEIMVNEQGNATGVKYFDSDDKGHIQTADIVVVSASANETPRLLLNSKSKLFPNGAGNNNDWVGRNLQGHAYTGAFGLFDWDILDFAGPGATMAICDFNHHNEGIIGGGLLANEFNRMPYLFSKIRPPGSSSWGKAHKNFQRINFKRVSRVVGPIQEMPNYESRIRLSPNIKDHWGIPVVQFSGARHPMDHEHCKFLSDKAEILLKEAGAVETWQTVGGKGQGGGHHQSGTARMGDDKQTSVTNRYGQIHDIDNLFVADGSLVPTNAGFNPALTYMALGYWVGEYIGESFKHLTSG
jgi:choline dehydrogenase-like flavoprotein